MDREHPEYPELTAEDQLLNCRLQLRLHEALLVVADDGHAVLDCVLNAWSPDAARRSLRDRYGFTEVQAQAVMDLQIGRLTSMDVHTFEQGRRELADRIAGLEAGLAEA